MYITLFKNYYYYNVWSTANTCEYGSRLLVPASPCGIFEIIRYKTLYSIQSQLHLLSLNNNYEVFHT